MERKQIDEALQKLRKNRENVGPRQREMLDAMIEVIDGEEDMDYVWDNYDLEEDDETFSAAQDAVNFLEGDFEIEDLMYPEQN